jgi:hypothetical protein
MFNHLPARYAAVPFEKSPKEKTLPGITRQVCLVGDQINGLTQAEVPVVEMMTLQRNGAAASNGSRHVAWPFPEQTRLPHCLGTSYWTIELMHGLRTVVFASHVGDDVRYLRPSDASLADRVPGLCEKLFSADLLTWDVVVAYAR